MMGGRRSPRHPNPDPDAPAHAVRRRSSGGVLGVCSFRSARGSPPPGR